MKKGILFVAIVLSASCSWADSRYESKVNSVMSAYMGKNIQTVVDAIGYYTREFKSPTGNRIYAWEVGNTVTSPVVEVNSQMNGGLTVGPQAFGNTQSNTFNVGGYRVTKFCNAYFEVDESNLIIDWKWNGNNCL